ncbi:hypothetical protein [Methanobrevibacter sp. UBA337]|jgi:tetratricopeptide (TPR) repeat protein|uniref:hypothetical protein n=1 Tax=Methanobrevibacter sp. UBA337 TaxID=1915480 RepID=UPI0039B9CE5A
MLDLEMKQKNDELSEREWEKLFLINQKAMQIEEIEGIEKAVPYYEKAVKGRFNGNYPYDKLTRYYRKIKEYDEEIRVCNLAIKNLCDKWKIPKFENRIRKIKVLKIKEGYENFTSKEIINLLNDKELFNYTSKRFKIYYKNKDLKGLKTLIPFLDKCLENKLSNENISKVYKMYGEKCLLEKNKRDALNYFESALKLNPNAKVKRNYLKLKKELE